MPTKGQTRRSTVPLDQDQLIESGLSIYIGHISVANNTAAAVLVEVQNSLGTTEVFIACNANDTVSLQADWLADKGVIVKSVGSPNVTCTIFHDSPGA